MSRVKRAVLWTALSGIVLLTFLSIYGAFIGAERAKAFFNSLPLAVYWFAVIALLVAGIVVFPRLLRVPSLLLMHLGTILVLIGAMWGSKAGHAMQSRLFGIDKIPEAQMGIYERTQENRVHIADANSTAELPFSVRLKDFRMEYYEPGTLIIQGQGQVWRLRGEPDARLFLGDSLGTIAVLRTFRNFKLRVEDGKQVPYEAPGGSNPALHVRIERPDGTTVEGFVFEGFPPVFPTAVELDMRYQRAVRDYVSSLEIVEADQVVAAKDIEVNHPLHYGGYHLYQHSYGQDRFGEYTVLQVVSDSGLNVVYAGYIMLIGGIVWRFWGRRTLDRLRTSTEPVGQQQG